MQRIKRQTVQAAGIKTPLKEENVGFLIRIPLKVCTDASMTFKSIKFKEKTN
jgi:hypothetical protein